MYMHVGGQMSAVYGFCNVQLLTKDVSQCEVTHQLPFVGVSSSVCQGPRHTEIIKHFHCDLNDITVGW